MICPHCGSKKSRCLDSRQIGNIRQRRYECRSCGERFNTTESIGEIHRPPPVCSKCLLRQNAEALCLTCSLAKAAGEWLVKRRKL